MPKTKSLLGFTLIEVLLVALIISLTGIWAISLSLSYNQKQQLELTSLDIASFFDLARQNSMINFEKLQHGIKISPNTQAFYHVTRGAPIETPIIKNQITIPNGMNISSPETEHIVWFNKKTGFIEPDSLINEIQINSKEFSSQLLIMPSGSISTQPSTRL